MLQCRFNKEWCCNSKQFFVCVRCLMFSLSICFNLKGLMLHFCWCAFWFSCSTSRDSGTWVIQTETKERKDEDMKQHLQYNWHDPFHHAATTKHLYRQIALFPILFLMKVVFLRRELWRSGSDHDCWQCCSGDKWRKFPTFQFAFLWVFTVFDM